MGAPVRECASIVVGAVGKPVRWHSPDRRAGRAPLRRKGHERHGSPWWKASTLRSGGVTDIGGAVGKLARWHSPDRRAGRAPLRRRGTQDARSRRSVDPGFPWRTPGFQTAVRLTSNRSHPGEGRDPVVETPADTFLPALDARLRGHDIGWGNRHRHRKGSR